MILSFSRKFPWGTDTNFKSKIQSGSKIHTFRNSLNMQPGHRIDFFMGQPRRPESKPERFFLQDFSLAAKFERFETDEGNPVDLPLCYAVEPYLFEFPQLIRNKKHKEFPKKIECKLKIGGLYIDENILELVAVNDGFENIRDFLSWFFLSTMKKKKHVLSGEIKHWTDQVYDFKAAKTI